MVSSGRDLDAWKLSRDVPTPKKRMLGPTPSIFFKVDARKTPKRVFGDPRIFVCRWSEPERRQKKRVSLF